VIKMISKEEAEKMKEVLKNLKTILYAYYPFIATILSRARIVAMADLDSIACVDRTTTIYLRKDFFRLRPQEQLFVLAHEAFHAALMHPLRYKKDMDRYILNIAHDIVVNNILESSGFRLSKVGNIIPIRGEDFGLPEGWQSMSSEEIYKELEERCPPKAGFLIDVVEKPTANKSAEEMDKERTEGGFDSVVLQPGSPDIYEARDTEEMEKKWRETIIGAAEVDHLAGNIPGELKRVVQSIVETRFDALTYLPYYIGSALGKVFVSTWLKPSRKAGDDLPGTATYARPTVWCAVDKSGSIDKGSFGMFLDVVRKYILQRCDVNVVFWDAQEYDVIPLKSTTTTEELVDKLGVETCGGTVIAPALEKLLKEIKTRQDVVVVLTDGDIFDFDKGETKELLSMVARKALIAIFVYTKIRIEHPGWISLVLQPA